MPELAAALPQYTSQAGTAARPQRRVASRAWRPVAVDAANVDDDRSDEDLQRNGGDEQTEYQRIEPMS